MLSYRYRFHGHKGLRYIYRNGHVKRSRSLTFRYVLNDRRVHPRFAVIIAKKIVKSAVRRNRIRRRIYEILRKELPNITVGTDATFTVTLAEIETMPSDQLQREVVGMLQASNLHKQASEREL